MSPSEQSNGMQGTKELTTGAVDELKRATASCSLSAILRGPYESDGVCELLDLDEWDFDSPNGCDTWWERYV